jgi:hypothetical protein
VVAARQEFGQGTSAAAADDSPHLSAEDSGYGQNDGAAVGLEGEPAFAAQDQVVRVFDDDGDKLADTYLRGDISAHAP